MNIQEFINAKEKCPICDTPLIIQFISSRKQKIRFIDGRLVIIFTMKHMISYHQDYEVGYSFDLQNNTFNIEFYTEWDTYKYVPMHLIYKFNEFHKNLGACCFRRYCTLCHRYIMNSNKFNLNFKTQQIGNLNISQEIYGLTMPVDDGFKIIKLTNTYSDSSSEISYLKSINESLAELHNYFPNKALKLPLIPFVSKEETAKRLDKLIIFS